MTRWNNSVNGNPPKKPRVYETKAKRIISFLKQKLKLTPPGFMDYQMFLSECALELEVKKGDVENSLEMFHDTGWIEIKDGKIISIPAKQNALIREQTRKDMKEEPLTDDKFDEIIEKHSSKGDNNEKS
ncbi:hypothetical protein LCGC14_3049350 [marine sediment metagenome]|uniref:Uncharacterized protein n=1 Tax=marine sediment metagenome TaxID=412755 RepID=A0A0F8WMP5_9ZZZZ